MTTLPRFVDEGVHVYSIHFRDFITKRENTDRFSKILGPIAKSETDKLSVSIRAQKRNARAEGRYLGGKVPFGFRLAQNGTVEKDRAQQAAIHIIFGLDKIRTV